MGRKILNLASKKRNNQRLYIRIILSLLAIALLWPVIPAGNLLPIVPALSPFVVISSILATRSFHTFAWLGLTMGIVVLVRKRFICRWICPVGLCNDGANKLGMQLGRRGIKIPSLAKWFVWLTIGGALLGYPIFLWMDPLSILANVTALVKHYSEPGIWISAVGFIFIVSINIMWPHIYCTKLCPLGGMQDILSSTKKSFLSVFKQVSNASDSGNSWYHNPSRRAMLALSAGAVLTWVLRPVLAKNPQPIRPPGAHNESRFVGVCTRCGSCLRVCPSNIIERDLGQNALASFLTPVLNFEKNYCREDCIKCTEACPSGALVRLSQKEKPLIQIGLPEVNMEECLLGYDQECSACQSACPYNAIDYEFSYETYSRTVKVDQQKCNGCGACEASCPVKPEKAILIRPIDKLRTFT